MEVMGTEAKIVCEATRVRPQRSEVMRLVASVEKIADLTGWQPEVTLREGLTRTAEYVRSHIDLYKPDIYNV